MRRLWSPSPDMLDRRSLQVQDESVLLVGVTVVPGTKYWRWPLSLSVISGHGAGRTYPTPAGGVVRNQEISLGGQQRAPVDREHRLPVRDWAREHQPILSTLLLAQPPKLATAHTVRSVDGPKIPLQQIALRCWCRFQVNQPSSHRLPHDLARSPFRANPYPTKSSFGSPAVLRHRISQWSPNSRNCSARLYAGFSISRVSRRTCFLTLSRYASSGRSVLTAVDDASPMHTSPESPLPSVST